MIEEGYGKKRLSRETGLSYNTVKTYLARMEAEASAGPGREIPSRVLKSGEAIHYDR
jgi:transposase